ncbi:MAG: PH domain-containing protein [Opitutaceae bacterium]|nr:PH domain-containing protein [Opitutaceae bacterium]
MLDRIRAHALRLLRVPPEPVPPLGAPGSVRTFRAGRNYYKLRLLRWGIGQVGALAGIIFSVGFLMKLQADVPEARAALERSRAAAVAAAEAKAAAPAVESAPDATIPEPKPAKKPRRPRRSGYQEFAGRVPDWLLVVAKVAEFGAIAFFLAQLPVTFALVRLEFEQHWYIVTDRSLRIRNGLVALQESTMSFANLQQVEVKQGPLQRWLGLADLHVRSAGGGSDHAEAHTGDSLHRGVFHCVENAQEIRDLILERLRLFRQAGLGDPDDRHDEPAATPSPPDTLAAAQELLAEARALRAQLGPVNPGAT